MNTVQLPITPATSADQPQSPQQKSEVRLQDLIPIAIVIAGGCETCAKKMVARALNEGSSWQDIDKTLRIVAGVQKLDCLAKALGPEIIARMDKPLAAGMKTLHQAMVNVAK
jgi:hypothetical protein